MSRKIIPLQQMKAVIDKAYEQRFDLSPGNVEPQLKETIGQAIDGLDCGALRVAEKKNGRWTVNEWLKKAVLLSFCIEESKLMEGTYTNYFDKIAAKQARYKAGDFAAAGLRLVPPAMVRRGAYIAPDTVIMPSFINIGAYVGKGTMIDSWATVGSCAQVGSCVHVSMSAGIGGVLEPLQAAPTIIEDNCFIGAGSAIVEGVIMEEGSVVAMGVFIGQSTKILDRATGKITYGRIPAGSVVVGGSIAEPQGNYNINCAIIVKTVDEKTRSKVSVNELLRDVSF